MRHIHDAPIHTAGLALLLLVLASGTLTADAQAETSTTSTYHPIGGLLVGPDDFPCLDESILIDGTLHLVEHTTFNAAGGENTSWFFNAPNVTAIGQSSGTIYRATGPGHFMVTDQSVSQAFGFTFLNILHLVGPGDATDLFAWTLFHVTENASGQTMVTVDVRHFECR